MTETHSRPAGRQVLFTFEEAMRAQLHKARRSMLLAGALPLLLLLAGAGVGAVLRLLPDTASTTGRIVLAVLVVIYAQLGTLLGLRMPPLPRVDWTTADTHEAKHTADLSPVTRAVLATAKKNILSRFAAATQVHVYVMEPEPGHDQSCTLSTRGCQCAPYRWTAALWPHPRKPILMIGQQLLQRPELLDFVLAHEAYHARRASWIPRTLLAMPLTAGALVLGLVVDPTHLLLVLPALWLVPLVLRWADELRADAAGIRAVSADAAVEYWAQVRAVIPRHSGIRRPAQLAKGMLAAHPPIPVRAALAKRARRTAG